MIQFRSLRKEFSLSSCSYEKITEALFQLELTTEKEYMMMCGAGEVTTNDPCCHEIVSNIARELFFLIPTSTPNYNSITLKLPAIVERLSRSCMQQAMTEAQVKGTLILEIQNLSHGGSCC
eukprot:TRINITY_DN7994_c0_g1_i1.p1 TRINITY_DN7994_c0_g1~~TRINITY_DN7994_c0_g1_i1.p1  ORF type:complete len:142 (-),score=17.99 TRINITY_DN7994_c0_g1_i1:74-436(-)